MKLLMSLITMAAFLVGCSDDDTKVINDITRTAGSKYNLKQKLNGFGYTRGQNEPGKGQMEFVMISFSTKASFDEDKSRKLIVDLVEDSIKIVNESPIKYQLGPKPVSEQHAFYTVTFNDKNNNPLGEVCVCNGKVSFKKKDYRGKLMDSSNETYSEAYQKTYGKEPPHRI